MFRVSGVWGASHAKYSVTAMAGSQDKAQRYTAMKT